jgi:hypothetical protein
VPNVVGEVDRCHAALPELALDDVPAAERRGEGAPPGVIESIGSGSLLRHKRITSRRPRYGSRPCQGEPCFGIPRLNGESSSRRSKPLADRGNGLANRAPVQGRRVDRPGMVGYRPGFKLAIEESMPRTHRQRPITYRDPQRRVWYVSEVAKLRVVSASIDGPNVALVIRFEREGEERFARWWAAKSGASARCCTGCSPRPKRPAQGSLRHGRPRSPTLRLYRRRLTTQAPATPRNVHCAVGV